MVPWAHTSLLCQPPQLAHLLISRFCTVQSYAQHTQTMESAASAATGHNYAMHDACNYYYNYYYTHLMASFPGQHRYPKGKTSLDLNEARDDGVFWSSGIHWTTFKQSAPCSRQITTPTTHHSIFLQANALPDAQPTVSTHWRQRMMHAMPPKMLIIQKRKSLTDRMFLARVALRTGKLSMSGRRLPGTRTGWSVSCSRCVSWNWIGFKKSRLFFCKTQRPSVITYISRHLLNNVINNVPQFQTSCYSNACNSAHRCCHTDQSIIFTRWCQCVSIKYVVPGPT